MAKLVVKRYATALFDMAAEDSALDKYEAQVKTILTAIEQAPELMAVLENAKVTLDEKITLVEDVFTNKVESPIIGLMVLMLKKGRQGELIDVFDEFLKMVKLQKGIIEASVTSAVPLKPEQVNAIKAKLEAGTKSKIELETIVDTSIIAGLVIKVGDEVVDASIKGDMQTLKKQLSDLKLA